MDHSDFWGPSSQIGCEHKTWQRFRLHQQNIKPGKYIRTLSHGDIIISQVLFDEQDPPDLSGVKVQLGGTYSAGELAEVRNFYFHKLETCSDPCDGKQDCTTFINGCGLLSADSDYLAGQFLISKNMKISYELKCDHSLMVNHPSRYILKLMESGGTYLYDLKYYDHNKALTIYYDIPGSDGQAIHHLNCAHGAWERMVFEMRFKKDEQGDRVAVTFTKNGILKGHRMFSDGHIRENEIFLIILKQTWTDQPSFATIRNFIHEYLPDRDTNLGNTDCTNSCQNQSHCIVIENCTFSPERVLFYFYFFYF